MLEILQVHDYELVSSVVALDRARVFVTVHTDCSIWLDLDVEPESSFLIELLLLVEDIDSVSIGSTGLAFYWIFPIAWSAVPSRVAA